MKNLIEGMLGKKNKAETKISPEELFERAAVAGEKVGIQLAEIDAELLKEAGSVGR